jgi:hypothetical protein
MKLKVANLREGLILISAIIMLVGLQCFLKNLSLFCY